MKNKEKITRAPYHPHCIQEEHNKKNTEKKEWKRQNERNNIQHNFTE